jgi:hypothetical protein
MGTGREQYNKNMKSTVRTSNGKSGTSLMGFDFDVEFQFHDNYFDFKEKL